MSVFLQIFLCALFICALVNADRIYLYTQPARRKLLYRFNKYFLQKSYKAAMQDALQLKAGGLKVYLLLWKGEWEAMPKQNFKTMWHSRQGMKKFTIQQWEKK